MTVRGASKLCTTQRATERFLLGISLKDNIANMEIRPATKLDDAVEGK